MTAPAVHAAICAVMSDLAKEGIEKGRRNEQQGYKFRGIEDVYNALCGLLAKHQLTMLPHELLSVERSTRETQKGGVLYVTCIVVRWKFTSAIDGSTDYAISLGEAMDSADKSTNKSMSAAYKYAAVQCFCIPTEGDDDADATTPEPSRPRTPPPQQREPEQRRAEPPPQNDRSKPLPTRTSANYTVKQYADTPFTSMPATALAEYIGYYQGKLKNERATLNEHHVSSINMSILAAQKELEARRAEEMKSGAASA